LYIEYEGTRYSGWQLQKNARTVQGAIAEGLHKVFKTSEFEFHGSGRTDAGVHALQQTAHLEVQTVLAPEIIRLKLNDELPADINILEVEKAPPHFHARHDAVARSYLYQISRRRTALGKRFVWWIKDELDVQAMQEASRLFVGMKDFRSFTDSDPAESSTKVLIYTAEWKEAGSLLLFRLTGSHFIWKLVRRIVGVLVDVGRGGLTLADLDAMFQRPSDIPAGLTAPPSGLFLERVLYKGEQFPEEFCSVLNVGHG
jgi:tRNA pseudouridine38-40 synthase